MASEQGESTPLPGDIEEWVADHTDDTGEDRADVLARAVASYRLLTKDADDETLASTLAELESRLEALEDESESGDSEAEADRIRDLEAELEGHVEDLRSRIVDVLKEARSRAPANHSHEALEDRLDEHASSTDKLQQSLDEQASSTDELRQSLDELRSEFDQFDETVDKRLTATEDELDAVSGSVTEFESKADKLAGAVVDLRGRLGQLENHVSHQSALNELRQTAARKGIKRAECANCSETVDLRLLGEPRCPHCNQLFETVEPGSMFLKSATLVVADRPELEAGDAEKAGSVDDTTTTTDSSRQESQ